MPFRGDQLHNSYVVRSLLGGLLGVVRRVVRFVRRVVRFVRRVVRC